MDENWIDLKGYEKFYEISNFGNIRNYKTKKKRKTYINNSGYVCIILYKNGKRKNYLIHRLVAENFLQNIDNYNEVNHKDEDKLNNKASNLEWCSHKQNCNFGSRNIRSIEKISRKIICIETNEIFLNATEIKKKYGYDNSLIHKCCKGQCKQAYGYHWKYKED